jgi:hypothetical protein
MSQIINIKAGGLYTNSNQVSVPEGSLAKAVNVNIDKDGVIESRRGFNRIEAFSATDDRADKITSYQDKLIAHRSNDNKLCYSNGSTWTDYSGTYSHPDADYARMKHSQMNGNNYFTSLDGVFVLDVYSGPVYSTGMPKGLDGEAALSGASGFMATNTQIAYRIVWGSKDTNSNLYLGSPSQRIVVANSSGGTRDVSLTFTIPSGISTSDFYQIYRSGQSSSSSTEANDELQIVYEANPSAGEITAKSITVVDATPDSLRGAYLYTNSNQEGIQESNEIPPFAKDICTFKNFMFFGNVKTKHQLNIKLLAVSGSSGLAVNDTITINSMVFTGKATETVASREFKVFTAGTASQNIDDTARSLIKVINQYSSNSTIYAYYLTGYSDLPGQILLEKRDLSASFTVSVSRATAWDIDDGTSDNQEFPHGLMWSKIQQPEHVPTSHLEYIGSKSSPIRRIVALRDSLFIFKDDGIFRLTGVNGQWSIDPLDTSTKLLAPESAVVLNNQIFGLTDQGIVSISDVGVAVISRPIEDELTELNAINYDNLKKLSFGVGYETDRKYILWTISSSADTFCTKAFVYNTFTKSWTTWKKDAKTGFVNPTNDKLYISNDSKYVLSERKEFSFRDYIDENRDGFSVVSSSGTSLVLNDTAELSIGDLIYSSSTVYSPITAIDASTSTVTLNDSKTFSVGAVSVYKAISCEVEWANQSCGNPGIEKLFQETTLLFREQQFNSASVLFYTDMSGGYSASTITGNYGGGVWGAFAWGSLPWGGVIRPKGIRVFVPREKSRGTLLSIKFNHKVGYGKFALNGFSLQYEFVSERINKV